MKVKFNKNKLKYDISDYGAQSKVATELRMTAGTLSRIINRDHINFVTLYAICSVIGTKPDDYVTEAGWSK